MAWRGRTRALVRIRKHMNCSICKTEMKPMFLPGSWYCPKDCDRKTSTSGAGIPVFFELHDGSRWAALRIPGGAPYPPQATHAWALIPSGIYDDDEDLTDARLILKQISRARAFNRQNPGWKIEGEGPVRSTRLVFWKT